MSHLYIDQHGCQLAIYQQQLIVRQTDKTERAYPLAQLQRIIITSQVHFTGAALKALFKHKIVTLFCSQNGYLQGQLKSGHAQGAQVLRRAKQYEVMQHSEIALPLARDLIYAKVHNQQRLLYDWSLHHKYSVKHLFIRIQKCSSLDKLRGYEGQAAIQHFAAIRHKLADSDFDFDTRQRRPAPDPVNALLSFAYALLQGELSVLADSYGLDNYVGFLHQPDHGQPALILDLMEPFRPIVDRLVVRLLLKHYSTDDFVITADKSCRIKDQRRAIILNAWENMMSGADNREANYRSLLQKQFSEWVHFLDGKSSYPHWWLMHKTY